MGNIIFLWRESSPSNYSVSTLYNPLNKSVNWSRKGTGNFSITHNLNNASHTVIVTATSYEAHMVMYVTPYSIAITDNTYENGNDCMRKMVQANYRRIKVKLKQIVADELDRIANDEKLKQMLWQN